jgi:hypothetical protein
MAEQHKPGELSPTTTGSVRPTVALRFSSQRTASLGLKGCLMSKFVMSVSVSC